MLKAVALALLLLAVTGCRMLRVQDPSLTAAQSKRGSDEGFRVGGGYEWDRAGGLFAVGAAGHVGYDSVGDTPVVWAEAHVTFAILSVFGGFWADGSGVGPAYGMALAWLLPTCELPEEEDNQGPIGALPIEPSGAPSATSAGAWCRACSTASSRRPTPRIAA